MWKVLQTVIQGTSHIKGNIPCQDKTQYLELNGVSCIALADGTGSCAYSHIGAECACLAACYYLVNNFDEVNDINIEFVKSKLIHRIRTRLGMKAHKLKSDKNEFSSTLLFFAVKGTKFILGHIGDGVIACLRDDKLSVLSYPENGEFANTTYFTTTRKYPEHFRLQIGEISSIKTVFLMSDGSAEAFFQKKTGTLAPALKTISSWISQYPLADVESALTENMQQLLPTHTADDCSIIIIQNED